MRTTAHSVSRHFDFVLIVCLVLCSVASGETSPYAADSLNYLKTHAATIVLTGTAREVEDNESHTIVEATVKMTIKGASSQLVRVYVPKTMKKATALAELFSDAVLFLTSSLSDKEIAHYAITTRDPVSLLVSRSGLVKPNTAAEWNELLKYLKIESESERLTWALSAASSPATRIQSWGVKDLSLQMETAPQTINSEVIAWTRAKMPSLTVNNQAILVQRLVALNLQDGEFVNVSKQETTRQLCAIIGNQNASTAIRKMAYEGIPRVKRPEIFRECAISSPVSAPLFYALSEFEAAAPEERARLQQDWKQNSDITIRELSSVLPVEGGAQTSGIEDDSQIAELQQLLDSNYRNDQLKMTAIVSRMRATPELIEFARGVVFSDRPLYLRERMVDAVGAQYSESAIALLAEIAMSSDLSNDLRIGALTGIGRHAKDHPIANQKLVELSSSLQSTNLGSLAISMIIRP